MGWFSDLRLRAKLVLAYASVFLVCMTCAALVVYALARQTIEENIERELENTTSTILNMVRASGDASVRNYLRAVAEKNRDVARAFYERALRSEFSMDEAKARAADVLLSQPIGQTGYIYCLNSQGVIVVHPRAALLGADLTEFAFIQEQLRAREGYLEYDWKNPGETRERAKALYMTWFEPWDWIISASSYRSEFASLIRVEDFQERILSLRFGETGYPYVIDEAGTLIIHPKLQGTNILDARDAAGRAFISELCAKRNGKIIYPWQNPGESAPREKLVIFNSIPELGWIVASSSYLDEFYRPLVITKRLFLTVGALILILIMMLSLWLAATFTRPLSELNERFAQGASGNYATRMPAGNADEFGQLGRWFNTFMDSLQQSDSRRRAAEAALRASEEKFRSIVDNALEGIFQTTPEGRFLSANPSMARIVGYDSPEALIRECFPIQEKLYVEPEDRLVFIRLMHERDMLVEHRIRFRRRDGSLRWGVIKARAVRDASGRIALFEGIFDDITTRQELEDHLRRARDEAEAASRMKSDFLSMMSHELRTPLTSILGFAKLIRRRLDSKVFPLVTANDPEKERLADQLRHDLDVVADEAGRLTGLLATVLDLCDLESGKAGLPATLVDVAGLLSRASARAATEAGQKGIGLTLEVEPDLPPVLADADRLLQVLDQLLTNALKFTRQGVITLRAKRSDDSGTVAISVSDTGIGLAPEHCESIFEPFRQLGDGLTDKPAGIGLGLTLCRLLVQRHGGRITASGEPGRGSVFRITLPVATDQS